MWHYIHNFSKRKMPKCIRTPGEVKVHTTLPERENGSKPSSQSSENPLHIRSGVTRKHNSVELHAAVSAWWQIDIPAFHWALASMESVYWYIVYRLVSGRSVNTARRKSGGKWQQICREICCVWWCSVDCPASSQLCTLNAVRCIS